MIMECFENSTSFGIPPVIENKPLKIGTEMQVLEISHTYDDGKMDIKTLGIQAFNLIDFHSKMEDKLYPCGEIERIQDDSETDIILAGRVLNLVKELYEMMKMNNEIPKFDSAFRIGEIAHKIGLNYQQEIALLKIKNEVQRLEFVESHLMKLIPIVGEMEILRKKVQMNGHFKNIIPPDLKL